MGHITRKVETTAGTTHTYDYTYDADSQLLGVQRDNSDFETYAYDGNGNRTLTQSGGAARNPTYDMQDRIVTDGATSFQFDDDGFLTQRTTGGVTDTFTYSTGGELLSATVGGQTVTYAYDASGRRVARTDTSGTYQYIYVAPGSVMPKAVRQPSGATSVLYYDASGALMAFDRGSDRFYVGSD